MSIEELIDAFGKADRRTKDIIFAFLVKALEEDEREQLARFVSLIV